MVPFGGRRLVVTRLLLPSLLLLLVPFLYPNPADAYQAGEAGGSVSGYQILRQTYHLNPEDPAMVDSIVLEILGKARPHRASIMLSVDGTWYDCSLTSKGIPNQITAYCEVGADGGIPVDSLLHLRAVATGG